MKKIFIALACIVALPVQAQQQPPKYAPIVIDEASYKDLTTFLMEVPAKYSLQILQWLEMQERKAQATAIKEAPAKLEGK